MLLNKIFAYHQPLGTLGLLMTSTGARLTQRQ
jgi:hypothetical protein